MRIVRALPVALVGLVLLTGSAAAHVAVDPSSAPSGEDVQLTFRVPNERRTTVTVQLQIQLPVEFERVEPGDVAGWEHRVEDDVVTWEGGRIVPGATAEFPLLVGPLPAGDPLVFRAVQTYDDGEVVRWIEEGDGVANPAPVLGVTGDGAPPAPTTTAHDAVEDEPASTAEESTTTLGSAPDQSEEDADDDDGIPAWVLWTGGLVLAAAVLAGLVAMNRRDPSRIR